MTSRVRRWAALAVLLTAACHGHSRTAAPAPSHAPAPTAASSVHAVPATLGRVWAAGGQVGYGDVRPTEIFNGGDPTGHVWDVTWRSWGQSRAIGNGMGFTFARYVADGHREPATVVAFDLGTCGGKVMYRKIDWFFPQRNEHWVPTRYINICTGRYSRCALVSVSQLCLEWPD